jgi:hypothetical protein
MHSLTNPHALVRITYFDGDEQDGNLANSAIEEISEIYQPTVEAGKSWGKFMPGDFSRIDTFRRREANFLF